MLSRRRFLSKAGAGTAALGTLAGPVLASAPATVAPPVDPAPVAVATRLAPLDDEALPPYLDMLRLVERLHRRLLDVVKDEFERRERADVSSTEALLIHNIGHLKLTASELRTRGYYLGSDVARHVSRLRARGFLVQERSHTDRRAVRISLTEAGHEIHGIVSALYEKHARTLEPVGGLAPSDIREAGTSLARLERFWTDGIRYRL